MRLAMLLVAVGIGAAGCGGGGTSDRVESRARALIAAFGCGACHTIPGVEGADGQVGPSLAGLADRRSIAGRLANTRDNLAVWIERPQQVDPGNLMPDLGLAAPEAAEIADYLERH